MKLRALTAEHIERAYAGVLDRGGFAGGVAHLPRTVAERQATLWLRSTDG